MKMTITLPKTEKALDGNTAGDLENSIHTALYNILDGHNEAFATSGTGFYADPARKEMYKLISYVETGERTFLQTLKRMNKSVNTILKLREDSHYEPLGYNLQFLIALVIEKVTPDNEKEMPRDSDYS